MCFPERKLANNNLYIYNKQNFTANIDDNMVRHVGAITVTVCYGAVRHLRVGGWVGLRFTNNVMQWNLINEKVFDKRKINIFSYGMY